jgi:hypothetical protein
MLLAAREPECAGPGDCIPKFSFVWLCEMNFLGSVRSAPPNVNAFCGFCVSASYALGPGDA